MSDGSFVNYPMEPNASIVTSIGTKLILGAQNTTWNIAWVDISTLPA